MATLNYHESLMDQGVDDIMCMSEGERLSGWRVHTAILRTEKLVQRFKELSDERVEAVEARARKALHIAARRFLWDLPGKTLENIPAQDTSLIERSGSIEDGDSNGGVGDYQYRDLLGDGSFGRVFRAEHPQLGNVAVKVIPKSTVKQAHALLSLDREFCIMRNLPRHVNVVGAHAVLHSEQNLHLVMTFAGRRSLDSFTLAFVKERKVSALAAEIAEDFCIQEAVAVAHLHRCMVCHRDLKPSNLIVSDDGKVLKLTDFGLSLLVCGPKQLLGESCGSLPFCAPEVLVRATGGALYDGFSADAWSLGVNFIELLHGPYSVDKILKWIPKPPGRLKSRIADLERLASISATLRPVGTPGIRRVIAGMLKTEPLERWTVERALGTEGVDDERARCTSADGVSFNAWGAKALNTKDCVLSTGVSSRLLEPLVVEQMTSVFAQGLAESLGGLTPMRTGLDKLWNTIVEDPSLGIHFRNCGARVGKVCSQMKSSMTLYLYPKLDPEFRNRVRNDIRCAHSGLWITDRHFDLFLDHFRTSFLEAGVSASVVDDALTRLRTARLDVTASFVVRANQARERSTLAWRGQVFDATQDTIADLSCKVTALVANDAQLADTCAATLTADALKVQVMQYLKGDVPLMVPTVVMKELSDTQFEHFAGHVRTALVEAKWPLEDLETVSFLLTEARHCEQMRNRLSMLSGCIQAAAWTRSAMWMRAALVGNVRTRFFAEHPGMSKCLDRLGGMLRDSSWENPDDLAEAHTNLGLDSEHFDIFLEVFEDAVGKHGDVSPGQMRNMNAVLRGLRQWVLGRSSWRQAVALNPVPAPPAGPPVGRPRLGCRVISEEASPSQERRCDFASLYASISTDSRISSFFAGGKHESVNRQAVYIDQVLASHSSSSSEKTLRATHEKWAITHYHFDCFMESLRASLTSKGSASTIPLGRLELLRSSIVSGSSAVVPAVHGIGGGALDATTPPTVDGVDVAMLVEKALSAVAADPVFKNLFPNGAESLPCKMMGLMHVLRCSLSDKGLQDMTWLRDFHSRCGLTSAHFSALRTAFGRCLEELGAIGEAAKGSVFFALDHLEQVLTQARIPLQGDTSDFPHAFKDRAGRAALLQDLGGIEGVQAIVDQWLDLLSEEPCLNCHHAPGSGLTPEARAKKAEYLVAMLADDRADAVTEPRKADDGRCFAEVHRCLRITDEHWTAYFRCLEKVLHERGVKESSNAVTFLVKAHQHVIANS
eukprot:TRINITY_DN67634_c0_g1_i1.p1 TRINITY_DN67634_c0_g1~~TRINITY_DN67634_c0_g1_i1.p1  ORF type:complete len:1388 (+),score=200.42 TRINITY_DN67634_c0_g1_i1:476-4165(+)